MSVNGDRGIDAGAYCTAAGKGVVRESVRGRRGGAEERVKLCGFNHRLSTLSRASNIAYTTTPSNPS